MNIKISIIVPCYNVPEELLLRCVNSILAQTFTDFEVILINDGSREEFLPALEKAEGLDDRIRLITQQNQGVSAARNNGISAAQGEYIVFVDADDLLLPRFLSEAEALAVKTDADFVIGGNAILDTYLKNEKNRDISDDFKTEIFCNEECEKFKPYLLGRLFRFGEHGGYIGRGPWTRILKRELAVSTPFNTSLPIGEDILWNLQLMEKCKKVCVAHRIWYLYYINSTSATHKYNDKVVDIAERQLTLFKEHLDFNSDAHFRSYCERILDELKRIYDYYLSSDKCPLTKKEKSQLISRLYTSPLWSPAGEQRFYKQAEKKSKLKSLLYKHKLLFLFFKVMSAYRR